MLLSLLFPSLLPWRRKNLVTFFFIFLPTLTKIQNGHLSRILFYYLIIFHENNPRFFCLSSKVNRNITPDYDNNNTVSCKPLYRVSNQEKLPNAVSVQVTFICPILIIQENQNIPSELKYRCGFDLSKLGSALLKPMIVTFCAWPGF